MYVCILQSSGLFERGKTYCNCINFTVPEVKILILLSYFIIFGIMTLVNFSVSINEANPISEDLFRYFACQLGGLNPDCEDIRRQLERHLKPELNGITYLLTGLITWVYLLFAIQAQHVKKLVQRIISCYYSSAKLLTRDTSSTSDKSEHTSTHFYVDI